MSLRSDIHAALDPMVPSSPHLAYAVRDAVREGRRPNRRVGRSWRLVAPVAAVGVGMAIIAFVVVNTFLLTAGPAQLGGQAHSTVNGSQVRLVWTTWTMDSSVFTTTHIGERPQLVGLDSRSVLSATTDKCLFSPGEAENYCVAVYLNRHGAEVLNALTSPAAAAKVCPEACGGAPPTCMAPTGVCPPVVLLTTWDNLTQDDIDHWNERGNKLLASPAVGGKFLGEVAIGNQGTLAGVTVGVFPTYQDAAKLARNIETVNG